KSTQRPAFNAAGDGGCARLTRTPPARKVHAVNISSPKRLVPEAASGRTGESSIAWLRLAVAVMVGSIGTVGMWSVPVVLPAVQNEFGVARADASLPYTLAMVGFAFGGVVMGRLSDRFGIVMPIVCGAFALGVGYLAAGFAPTLTIFALLHLLVGFGASATFGPLIADTSQWFTQRRGIAGAISSSGNSLAVVFGPPVLQPFIAADGWRATLIGVAVVCVVTILPLLLLLRRRAPVHDVEVAGAAAAVAARGLSPVALQVALSIAG